MLACDPGLKGAFCLFDAGKIIWVKDMPVVRIKGKSRLDFSGLRSFIPHWLHAFVIEDVSGAPGQSAPSAFNFGYGVGYLVATAEARGVKVIKIRPAEWKPAMKVPADKKLARARATELFPDDACRWARVKDDGRAEAAMLALYAERKMNDGT